MPSSFERQHRRELLIIDTGPIRELVTFYAVEHFGFRSLKSELQFIRNRHIYERCGKFIGGYRSKATSASVVGELYSWIRKTDDAGQLKLWNRVYDEFQGMGMDEEAVKLLEMKMDLVSRLGPVDVSMIELARRHSAHRPLVLTIDGGLYRECKRAGLNVSRIEDIEGAPL